MRITFFHTPKPHRFEYKPRFYNPETEEYDLLKKKYETAGEETENADKELLEYYKKKLESPEKESLKNFFGKKKVRKFSYKPKFHDPDKEAEESYFSAKNNEGTERPKINLQRSKFYDDRLFSKPAKRNGIIISIVVVILLLLLIFL